MRNSVRTIFRKRIVVKSSLYFANKLTVVSNLEYLIQLNTIPTTTARVGIIDNRMISILPTDTILMTTMCHGKHARARR